MAVGLLGGAFDPPHNGHLALARAAIEQLDLEGLLVLVAAQPGHKDVVAPAVARLELARAAFRGVHEAIVQLDEHARTVDSLEARRPGDAYFVLGSDQLADFWEWKRPERVLELVRLAVARRPGVSESELARALERFPDSRRVAFFEMPEVPVSSSDVRERLARNESITSLVPRPVAEVIARLGLYGTPQ